MHIFTYGTLMFPEVWRAVAGREFSAVEATLDGYAVYRVRDAEYPGMVAASGKAVVRGIVYLDVDDASVERLDRFEGRLYRRQTVLARCANGHELLADTYVVIEEERADLTDESWQREEFISRGDLARFATRYEGFGRIVD